MNRNNLVSVIIPAYNTSKYIKKTLESVINQTYSNLEIIVIDDGSTDETVEIVKRLDDERIVILKNVVNMGVSATRNRGVKYSNGRYICFLDSDDIWCINKIEKQLQFMRDNNYPIICSDYNFSNYKGNKKAYVKVPSKISYEDALKNTTIFISTVMIDLNIVDRNDVVFKSFNIAQDTMLWWTLLKKYKYIYGINGFPSIYVRRKNSLSSNKIKAVVGSFKAYMLEELSFFDKIKYFL